MTKKKGENFYHLHEWQEQQTKVPGRLAAGFSFSLQMFVKLYESESSPMFLY